MALIVEDGSCVEGASSYVSLEEAEACLAPRGLWPAAGIAADAEAGAERPAAAMTGAREAALTRAFDFLNSLEWLGEKPCWGREPAWPRCFAPVPGSDPRDGEYIPENIIPPQVKRAQMELAALILAGLDPFAPRREAAIISESASSTDTVDALTETRGRSVTYERGAPAEDWLPGVYPLLAPFLKKLPGKREGGFTVLGVRAWP